MKLSRDQLKVIIKEVVIELLSEGLGSAVIVEKTLAKNRTQVKENVTKSQAINPKDIKRQIPRTSDPLSEMLAQTAASPAYQKIRQQEMIANGLQEGITTSDVVDDAPISPEYDRWSKIALAPPSSGMLIAQGKI